MQEGKIYNISTIPDEAKINPPSIREADFTPTVQDDGADVFGQRGNGDPSSIADLGDLVAAQAAAISALESDLVDAEAQIADLEEAEQEREDIANGAVFVHTFNHTGDYRVTSGWVGDWGFFTSIKMAVINSNNGDFNITSEGIIAKAWNNGNETGAGSFYLPGNQQGMIVSLRAVGPDATLYGTVGSGNFNTVTLGLLVTGDAATIEAKMESNSTPNVVTDTAWFPIGRIVKQGGTHAYLFTGSGGSTTRDEIDGA